MMGGKTVFSMNKGLKKSIVIVIIEGLLGGCNFIVLFEVLNLIFGEGVTLNSLMSLTGIVAVILVLRIIIYSFGYIGSQIGGAEVSKTIRIALGDKLKKIPLNLFSNRHTGTYISAATTEVSSYEQVLTHKVADIIKYSIVSLMASIFAGSMNIGVGITIFTSTLLLVPILAVSFACVKKYGPQKINASSENVRSITEYITGIQTLRSYGLGGIKNETLTASMKNFSDISYIYEKMVIPVGAVYFTINCMSLPLSILFAGSGWLDGILSSPQLVMLLMLPMFIAKLNIALFIDMTAYKNFMISKNNINKIMVEEEENSLDVKFGPKGYDVVFENVNFQYVSGERVLNDISFTIPSESFTAIVGDSGSGKSTILNLISKYYIPQNGTIRIGGYSIENLPSEKVFSCISAVDQDVFLFNDTVKNNIRYARPTATDEEVKEACRLANCETFILNMEKGYDTEIGENGNKLSGGERQRLSVARAILKDSPIILLDEATASLDIENELLVKQAISNLLRDNKTVIMIAHTLPIIKNADKILVVENGRIAESGTHAELVLQNRKYATMWKVSQKLK
jgi:ATP-binding cassette subfamily B protein